MSKPKAQVIGLKTLDIRGASGMNHISTPVRPSKKRVFTENEYQELLRCSTKELRGRLAKGNFAIWLLHRPEMLNMTPVIANMVSSNVHFQMDEIQKIIDSRNGS